MKYKQIKAKKLYEEVAEILHGMIRTGQLKPGDKLDSVQLLAENFRVGQWAIREALSALRAMGLVEMKQGEGTFVKSFETSQLIFPLSNEILMDKEDITHLLEVRKIIEAGTAATAAKNRTEEDIEAMFAALDDMQKVHGIADIGDKADYKFHLTIADATHNPLLSNLLVYVSELMFQTQKEVRKRWLFSEQTTGEQLYEQQHKEIFHAIVDMDEEGARKAMLSHLCNVEVLLNKYFKEGFESTGMPT